MGDRIPVSKTRSLKEFGKAEKIETSLSEDEIIDLRAGFELSHRDLAGCYKVDYLFSLKVPMTLIWRDSLRCLLIVCD